MDTGGRYTEATNDLGLAYARAQRDLGDLPAAEAAFERALAIDPNDPETLRDLGELHLGRKRVIAAFPVVTFYATDPEAVPELRALLQDFAQTLPPGVRFTPTGRGE